MSDDRPDDSDAAELGLRELHEGRNVIYIATCSRCGLDVGFRSPRLDAEWPFNPIVMQGLAEQLGCPRSPRICGTIKIKAMVKENANAML
jgi:hypothetical protein